MKDVKPPKEVDATPKKSAIQEKPEKETKNLDNDSLVGTSLGMANNKVEYVFSSHTG